jgi:uncharacterized protein
MNLQHDRIIAQTRAWVERVVIGLNLCPFAKAVQVRGQIRHVVCDASDEPGLLATLRDELERLARSDPAVTDTTLLIHPNVLTDFDAYNQFLDAADAVLVQAGFEGIFQLASFHPDYRFAGSASDDIDNATNRSPYPMLHLLREASVDRAVAAFPDAAHIYEANMRTMRALGRAQWRALMAQCCAAGCMDDAEGDARAAGRSIGPHTA